MTTPEASGAVPEGFELLGRGGPFLRLFGPLYVRRAGGQLVIAIRIEEKHLNSRGIVHGGMLVTLADSALGIVLSTSQGEPRPLVSVSLSADFADAARLGDWVEVPVFRLDDLPAGWETKGPALFESATTTVLARAGERVSVTPHGWLDLHLV